MTITDSLHIDFKIEFHHYIQLVWNTIAVMVVFFSPVMVVKSHNCHVRIPYIFCWVIVQINISGQSASQQETVILIGKKEHFSLLPHGLWMYSTVGNVFHTYSEKLVGVRHQTWKFAVIGWLLIASITSAPAYKVMCCRSWSFKGIRPPDEYFIF
jgi:hypothetical protein